MKIPVDFAQPESIYREPTCFEKCVLGAKCGFGSGFVLGSLLAAAGAVKTKIPKGSRLKPVIATGLFCGTFFGTVLTSFVRFNC